MKNQTASALKMKTCRYSDWFLDLAGMWLLVGALLLGWFNLADSQSTSPHDPLTGLRLHNVFWICAAMLAAVALYCLFGKSHLTRIGLVIWLAANLLLYDLGQRLVGSMAISASFGLVAHKFGMTPQILETLTWVAIGYFLIGGFFLMGRSQLEKKKETLLQKELTTGQSLKNTCPNCGGHVLFSAVNIGQQIPCPHCQGSVVLRQFENLKMSCFFCQGHIEFPAHALGTKMHCPHCNKDITLKEQI